MEARVADETIRSLLAPLDRVEPVELRRPRRRIRRATAFAVGLVAAVIGTGVAFATGIGPFAGISSADRPQQPADVLDPAVVAQLRSDEAPGGDQIGSRLAGSARLVGTLPSGRKVYVVSTTKARLCVLVAGLAESCGNPLTAAAPLTFTIVDADGPGGEAPIAYGVARDGVTAVSFTVGGRHEVVPVRGNMFAFQPRPFDGAETFSSPEPIFGG